MVIVLSPILTLSRMIMERIASCRSRGDRHLARRRFAPRRRTPRSEAGSGPRFQRCETPSGSAAFESKIEQSALPTFRPVKEQKGDGTHPTAPICEQAYLRMPSSPMSVRYREMSYDRK
jgi:hypothetical protein